jgi:A-macroglobulin complement component/alpha-2-macroglobulin family protein/MG2 domain-containing protein/A-macroglobulin receptor
MSQSFRAPRYALTLALAAAGASACSSSSPGGGPPEVFENASGSIRESSIRASLTQGSAELLFPLQKLEKGTLKGTLFARLVDVSAKTDTIISFGQADIEQSEDSKAHTLVLTGLPADLDRAKTGAIVIQWSIKLAQGELRGKRSLYAALGKVEVEVRGATEIPGNQGVPMRIIARDPDTLAPKAGAAVTGTFTPRAPAGTNAPAPAAVPLFEGTTDAKGELLQTVRLPDGSDEGTLRIEVRAGDSDAWVKADVRAVKEKKIALSADKTIYKPGQTIELRALALRPTDKAPLASEDVAFEALDGKGNKVFKRHATTDDFGVASMHLVTDTDVNEGVWTIRAIIDGAKIEKKIPVTRYNLPKMKVTVAADREYATEGDTIHGRVDARYLFGSPVANANVAVVLKVRDSALATASATTDENGTAQYTIMVPSNIQTPPPANCAGEGGAVDGAGPAAGGAARQAAPAGCDPNASDLEDGKLSIVLEASVTDSANQSEVGQRALPLTAGALVVQAISEAQALVPGVENIVWFIVSDPIGRPISATLTLDGLGPMMPLQSDADGVAEVRFTPAADAKSVSISATAADGAGRTKTRTLTLTPSDQGVLIVRTDKAVYQSGESATVKLLSSSPASRIYLDIYKGGLGVQSNAIDLSNGQSATLVLPISDAMRGVVLLDAFYLAGSGNVVRGTARVLVDPKDRLDVAIESDNDTYAPGGTTQIRVRVKDSDGRPQVASVGLFAVDEAVFALGGEPDGDLRTFFDADPRVVPNELRVLGKGAGDLFAGAPAAMERFARLLFASAKGGGAIGLDYNSIREELPAVKSSLSARVTRDAVAVLKAIAPSIRRGTLDQLTAADVIVPRAKLTVDPFGHLYDAKLDEHIWTQLVVTSAGPDETPKTADDVTVSVDFGWLNWADLSTVDDNGMVQGGFGGGVDAADRAAGEAGPPAAPNVPAPDPNHSTSQPASSGRVRSDFRETVFANPTLITDANGVASVSFPLADSITTWRISAEGSTKDGKLGASRLGVRTFQSFFIDFDVPVTLTRNDVIELPAVVYNYLSTPQQVTVTIDPASWIDILSQPSQSVMLNPSEVRAVKFSIRAKTVGAQQLTIHGSAGSVSDALVREALVKPDGVADDQSFSNKVNGTRDHTITIPADAIANSTKVVLALTPGFAGQAVQGTEALLKEPNGCFEQTTSSAWPNTLVTTYLETTGQLTPELKEKAFALVTRGYQRLLKFESPTGGFNWWGNNDPGNRILSAIMLWHLKDLEKIIETDDAVRTRTLTWLLAQQRSDGSWASGDALHAGDEILGTNDVRTTAFISWALAHTGWASDAVSKGAGYLRAHMPTDDDVYAVALAANALAVVDASDSTLSQLFARLDGIKKDDGDGKIKWTTDVPSWTGAGGNVGEIETTSLIAYGLMRAQAYPQNVDASLRFLVAHKDAVGSWYNTQATMNALRALLQAASPQGSDAVGTLTVKVNGQAIMPIAITREDGDLYRQVDLTDKVVAGDNTISLDFQGTGDLTYQLSRRSYRPRQELPGSGPFALAVAYQTTSPGVGQSTEVRVTATYTGSGLRDQVMVRVGRAPGFTVDTRDLEAIVQSSRAARYEVTANDVTFYLMNMHAGEARDLSFHVTPTLAMNGQAPASAMYAYYDASIRTDVAPVTLTVSAR